MPTLRSRIQVDVVRLNSGAVNVLQFVLRKTKMATVRKSYSRSASTVVDARRRLAGSDWVRSVGHWTRAAGAGQERSYLGTGHNDGYAGRIQQFVSQLPPESLASVLAELENLGRVVVIVRSPIAWERRCSPRRQP
jgi:hypothetical protein